MSQTTIENINLAASICSILSLLVSLFVASKVYNIKDSFNKTSQKVKGDTNTTVGGDYVKK
ncbi:MAG: hypothetical protein IPK68_11260 [Bdellovibrionales bacterium]|nr:hypothetical protein [Bdellovibrionales bacterium]